MSGEVLALPMECWRWIPGFEGWYQVSNRGRVRSVGRWVDSSYGSKQFREGRILKPRPNKFGYLTVVLSRDGKPRGFSIHRLVAMAFIPNPDGKPEVNHLNEQKEMNFVENLSWVSRIENIRWGTGRERRAASMLNGKLSKPVLALNPKTGQVVKEFPSANEAGRKGFKHGAISQCCRGERKSYKGLVWRFKDDYDRENAWTPVKIGSAASQSMPVEALDPETGQVVKEFSSTMEAQRNGFDSGTISKCCRGKFKQHKGYIWRYKES